MEATFRVKTAKTGSMILSVIGILAGLLLVFRPNTSLTVFARGIALVLIATGIIRLIGYYSRDLYRLAFQFDRAMGVALIILGAVLLFYTNEAIDLLHVALGIVALLDGTLKIRTAIDAKNFGLKEWWIIGITAAVVLIFGVILFINPAKGAGILVTFMGIALIFLGITNFVLAFYGIKIGKKGKQKIYTLSEEEFKEE